MTRIMYDAVTATNIPRNPPPALVAGYGDVIKLPDWSQADWNLFPQSVHVVIVKKSSSLFGNVLDVEKGDADPAQVPGWLIGMRNKGYVPSVYTSYSNWNAVQSAINSAGITHPPYWIADYSRNPATWWPTLNGIEAVAWQYTDNPPNNPYDTSLVKDYWEGVDDMATLDDTFQPVDGSGKPVGSAISYAFAIQQIYEAIFYGGQSTGGTSLFDHVDAVGTKVSSGAGGKFTASGEITLTPEVTSGNA